MTSGGSNKKLSVVPPEPGTTVRRPPHMSDEARLHWNRHAAWCVEFGTLTTQSRDLFVSGCENWSAQQRCHQEIAENGVIVRGVSGTQKRNPAVSMLTTLQHEYRLWCAEFGLSPSGKVRLGLDPESAANKEAENFLYGPRGGGPRGVDQSAD